MDKENTRDWSSDILDLGYFTTMVRSFLPFVPPDIRLLVLERLQYMPNYGNTDKVLTALKKHLNEQVTVTELIAETGLGKAQILGALGNMVNKKELNVHRIIDGQVFIMRSGTVRPAKAEKRVFEELVITKTGRILIQDQDGVIYEAKELE